MRAKVQRWGNSLALRIPKTFASEMGIRAGSEVDIALRDGALVVTPAVRSTYRLEDLLAEITPENLHTAIDTGVAAGDEAW